MELIPLNCNGCGAALDVAEGTRFATCRHCGARLAVKRSESAAYTELIEALDRKTDAIADQVAELQLQNELERIDCDWEQERKRYLMQHKNGSTSEPNAVIGTVIAVLLAGFGIFWSVTALSMGAPNGFGCFGFMFVVVAVGIGAANIIKSREYEEARQRYRKRRRDAESRRQSDADDRFPAN